MTLLVIAAIVIAGMVARAVQGDYVYFGVIGAHMPVAAALVAVPVAGAGGAAGGLFARATLALATGTSRATRRSKRRPVGFAALCGPTVGALGVGTGLLGAPAMAPRAR